MTDQESDISRSTALQFAVYESGTHFGVTPDYEHKCLGVLEFGFRWAKRSLQYSSDVLPGDSFLMIGLFWCISQSGFFNGMAVDGQWEHHMARLLGQPHGLRWVLLHPTAGGRSQ